MYLVFNTYEEAILAESKISLNMGLPKNKTVNWSEIDELKDGTFSIVDPNEFYKRQKLSFLDSVFFSEKRSLRETKREIADKERFDKRR